MFVDPDIRRAATLPAEVYTDPAIHARLVDRLFPMAWLVLDEAGPDASAQDGLRPAVLGAGTLDEPVIVVREGGAVRVISNVCTHRGLVLLSAPSAAQTLRCPYHGRRFGWDGRCRAAPGFEGAEGVPGPQDDLPTLASASWGPLAFAGLEPATAFADWWSPVGAWVDRLGLEGMVEDPNRRRTYEVAAPWLAYLDNYLEGFHIPYVHPGLAESLDVQRYPTVLFEQGSLQVGLTDDPNAAFRDLPPAAVAPAAPGDEARFVAGLYVHLFPNTLLNFYPWGLSLNVVEPRGVDGCVVHYRSYVAHPERLDAGASADLHQVELEDEAVVEGVARGLRSRLYRQGRFSPTHERCVHHWQRFVDAALAAG